jgi:A/G-specific adenine glycosylase
MVLSANVCRMPKEIFDYKRVVEKLAAWFSRNKRPMPWRNTRDPYRIWLSEIMLQQTQVATVIPYYEKFVARFPTVNDLARAPLDDVLKLWAGLGYYSRARNLHRGAQAIAGRFSGTMPDTLETIREIPGIGPYTAGAVLSIAYSRPVALVDGNVARVFSRMRMLGGDWRQNPAKDELWKIAGELVSRCGEVNPGDLNQALMELGATVCTPRAPECSRCPVSTHCAAFKHKKQDAFPQIAKKAAVPVWKLRAWIVRDSRGRMLFAQREPDGLFGGLWEVPTERCTVGSAHPKNLPHRKNGGQSPPYKLLGRVKHTLSHRELRIDVVEGAPLVMIEDGKSFPCWSGAYTGFRWVKPDAALAGTEIALSSVQKKVLQAALKKSVQHAVVRGGEPQD